MSEDFEGAPTDDPEFYTYNVMAMGSRKVKDYNVIRGMVMEGKESGDVFVGIMFELSAPSTPEGGMWMQALTLTPDQAHELAKSLWKMEKRARKYGAQEVKP